MTYKGYGYDMSNKSIPGLWCVAQMNVLRLGVTNQCFLYPDQLVCGGYDRGWKKMTKRRPA